MTNTTVASGNVHTRHLADFWAEYTRANEFSRYTGTDANSVIQRKSETVTGRQAISIPLVGRLSGNGVSGSTTLRGSGEALKNFNFDLTPTYYRNAVEFTKEELEKPNFDMFAASREQLMTWAMSEYRDRIIAALNTYNNGGTTGQITGAVGAAEDAFLADNTDRTLFGTAKGNLDTGNDFSASLLNVDTTADKLDADIVSLAKRMAKTADPHIRPIRVNEGEEWYVAFTDSLSFRDLKVDLKDENRDGWIRGRNNPIFKDGDLIWDGVIIREVPEISVLSGVGASTSDVGKFYLCGAQALGWAVGKMPNIVRDMDEDYGFQPGIAVEMKEAVGKVQVEYTSGRYVDWGMVTAYVSSSADS